MNFDFNEGDIISVPSKGIQRATIKFLYNRNCLIDYFEEDGSEKMLYVEPEECVKIY